MTVQHSLRGYLLLGFAAMLMLAGRHLRLGRVDRNLGRGDRAGQAGGRQQRQEGAAPDGRRGRHPQRQGRRSRQEGRHRGAARRDAGPRQLRHRHQGARRDGGAAGPARGRARRRRQGHLPGRPARPPQRARGGAGDDERAAAVRAAPLGARGPEGAAPGADRPAPPADPRQRRAGGGEDHGDRLEPAGAGRHPRPVEAEPGAVQPRDDA